MKKVLVLIGFMVFLMAGAAQADNLTLTSGGTYQAVNITDPTGIAKDSSAGLFQVNFGTPPVLYNAFCADYANIAFNIQYSNFTMIGVPNLAPYNEAAYIFENYGNASPAAAQVAIWEVVFEGLSGGTPGDLSAGKFILNGGLSAGDVTAANSLITAALANGANFNAANYRLLVSPDTNAYYGVEEQDWIVRLPVPEPGSLMLLGLGLLGLVGVARRKKS